MLSRRDAILGTAAAAAVAASPKTALARTAKTGSRAKRVILAVSDGMSLGTMSLADQYSNVVLGAPTFWPQLMQREGVSVGFAGTSSANSMVTDSAAAATAWSTGKKVYNGSICYLDEQTPLEPIHAKLERAGIGLGLVTTTRITHATPAAFYAQMPRRALEDGIGTQLAESTVDVAMGGGWEYLKGKTDRPGVAASGPGQPLPAPGSADRLLAFTHDSHVPYVLDRAGEPSLEDMTEVALKHLDIKRPGGWLLQVEAGRVDHAAHENDAPSLIMEQLEFDRTVAMLAAYADSRDDTLLIVTTDHANANPGLTIYGPRGEAGLRQITGAKQSMEWMVEQLNATDRDASSVRAVFKAGYGIELSDERAQRLSDEIRDPKALFRAHHKHSSSIGAEAANDFAVSFVSPNHTSDHVLVTAQGPGSDLLPTVSENTDLFGIMLDALGVAHAG